MKKVNSKLQIEFENAVKRVSETDVEFAPDIKLQFYAYYKRALGNAFQSRSVQLSKRPDNALVRGFKMNALFQVSAISEDEAKEKYIELADRYL